MGNVYSYPCLKFSFHRPKGALLIAFLVFLGMLRKLRSPLSVLVAVQKVTAASYGLFTEKDSIKYFTSCRL